MLASFRIRAPTICDSIKGVKFMSNNLSFSKFKLEWHFFRLRYNELLLEGCLDYELKSKIQRKISYHKLKLNNF